jgi:NADH-quinone oxidoreductase subunit F
VNLEQIRLKTDLEYNRQDESTLIIGPSALDPGPGLFNHLQSLIERSHLKARLIAAGPMGYPDLEPLLIIRKPGQPGVLYPHVTPEIASTLIDSFVVHGGPGPDLALGSTGNGKIEGIPVLAALPLFSLQNRVALRNCGFLDPQEIGHYISCAEGYSGLSKALQMGPDEVIRQLDAAGLRGRGGAGYPTAQKWKNCREAEGNEKYLVCNAIDSDPLAGTARLLLESDPHSVLEGLLIGAYAVGAAQCFLCVGAENSLAVARLNRALEQMRQYGLLGENILDSDFSTEISIKALPSRLVAGEETALLRFLEGKQTMPFIRPPYPAFSGLKNNPTVVNNLETLADAAVILQKGADWFNQLGTEKSKGTKVLALSGDITHRCILEVPFGTTLRSIIEKAGGGVPGNKKIKAVQLGGPAGSFLTSDSLDLPIDFASLDKAGAILGSGTIEVFAEDACAVQMAAGKMDYLHDQSCGKCVFCREGTLQMSAILADIAECKGKSHDLELLIDLGKLMREGSICGLGKNAPAPALSSLKLFPKDYEAHLKSDKDHCPTHA